MKTDEKKYKEEEGRGEGRKEGRGIIYEEERRGGRKVVVVEIRVERGHIIY